MSKPVAVILSWLAALTVLGSSATAGTITFTVPTITLDYFYGLTHNQSGYFDVTISETGGSDKLYGFQSDLYLNAGTSNITFLNADFNTQAPYVYAGNSGAIGEGGTVYFANYGGPTQSSEVSNADTPNSGSTTLSTTVLGLMRFEYFIPAGTQPGSYGLVFNQNDPNQDPFADFVNITSATSATVVSPNVVDGAIIVSDPEPSSIVLAFLAAAGLLIAARRRR